jgi:hypothetical protein
MLRDAAALAQKGAPDCFISPLCRYMALGAITGDASSIRGAAGSAPPQQR